MTTDPIHEGPPPQQPRVEPTKGSFYDRNVVWINIGILGATGVAAIATVAAAVAVSVLFPPLIPIAAAVGGAALFAEATVAASSANALRVAYVYRKTVKPESAPPEPAVEQPATDKPDPVGVGASSPEQPAASAIPGPLVGVGAFPPKPNNQLLAELQAQYASECEKRGVLPPKLSKGKIRGSEAAFRLATEMCKTAVQGLKPKEARAFIGKVMLNIKDRDSTSITGSSSANSTTTVTSTTTTKPSVRTSSLPPALERVQNQGASWRPAVKIQALRESYLSKLQGAQPKMLESGEVEGAKESLVLAFDLLKPVSKMYSPKQLSGYARSIMTGTPYTEPATEYIFKVPLTKSSITQTERPLLPLSEPEPGSAFIDNEMRVGKYKRTLNKETRKFDVTKKIRDIKLKDSLHAFWQDNIYRPGAVFRYSSDSEVISSRIDDVSKSYEPFFEKYKEFLDRELSSEQLRVEKTKLYKFVNSLGYNFAKAVEEQITDEPLKPYIKSIFQMIDSYDEQYRTLMRVKFLQCVLMQSQIPYAPLARHEVGVSMDLVRVSSRMMSTADFSSPQFDAIKLTLTFPANSVANSKPFVQFEGTREVSNMYTDTESQITIFANPRFSTDARLEDMQLVESLYKTTIPAG